MRGTLSRVSRAIGLKPCWRVRLTRGYAVMVRLRPGFVLGTIEGGHDFRVRMMRRADGWRERIRGYNASSKNLITFEGPSSANPYESTFSIFGAVFRFNEAGQVFYDHPYHGGVVGELKLPGE